MSPLSNNQKSIFSPSSNPLGITPETLETEVWEDYFQETISKVASENGISLTVCFLLWQVFNRLADEFHFPPRLERPDMQKILQKTTRFFSKTHARYECINERDYEPLPFLDFLLILWREAKNEVAKITQKPFLSLILDHEWQGSIPRARKGASHSLRPGRTSCRQPVEAS